MSLMTSFCAFFFPRDFLDEIWALTGLVSDGFPTYCLTALSDSIAVYIEPSPRRREKEKRNDR